MEGPLKAKNQCLIVNLLGRMEAGEPVYDSLWKASWEVFSHSVYPPWAVWVLVALSSSLSSLPPSSLLTSSRHVAPPCPMLVPGEAQRTSRDTRMDSVMPPSREQDVCVILGLKLLRNEPTFLMFTYSLNSDFWRNMLMMQTKFGRNLTPWIAS